MKDILAPVRFGGLLSVAFCLLITANALEAQWIQTNGPGGDAVTALALSGTNLFAGTSGGVFLTTNNGASWSTVNSGLTNTSVLSFAVSGSNLFAATDSSGVFLSTNSGTSWTNIGIGLGAYTSVNALAINGTNLIAGTSDQGVYTSTNNGATWTAGNTGLTSRYVYALSVDGADLFAGGGGVFRSTNKGSSWTQVTVALVSVYAFAVKDEDLFAGGSDLFRSTNSGTTWIAADSGVAGIVSSFAVWGTNIFAGTNGGVFLSTDNGTTWNAVNDGLTNTDIRSLSVSGPNLFAGTFGGSVWRRPLSEMITSVQNTSTELPTHFSLSQNYPNPFNPSTTIRYGLPNRSSVRIVITNTLGQEVAVLTDGEQEAGSHDVQWHANVASGIYFYRIDAVSTSDPQNRFVQVRKMMLLK